MIINDRAETLPRISTVAAALAELRPRAVFLGGAVTPLLITDPAAYVVRPTKDVDLVIEVASTVEPLALNARLRALGFREDTSEDAPTCRWLLQAITVDVVTTGSSTESENIWYGEACHTAATVSVGAGPELRIVRPPIFIATKLEAFKSRGGGDFQASHDLEDIVAVFDGRPELISEVGHASDEVQAYLRRALGELLDRPAFLDSLPGHLSGDAAGQLRAPQVLARLRTLVGR